MSRSDFEVVVIGGGTAGAFAAMAAGRMRARTCLVEAGGLLGGTCLALGNAIPFHNNRGEAVVGGLPQELVDRMIGAGGAAPAGHLPNPSGIGGSFTPFDPEIMKRELFEMVEEAGVTMVLHTAFVEPIVENGGPRGIRVHNKSGLHEIRAEVFVDATGDADLVGRAGGRVHQDAPEDALNGTLLFRVDGVDSDRYVADIRKHPERMVLLADPYLRDVRGLDSGGVMERVESIFHMPYIYITNLVRDYVPRRDWPKWNITGTDKSEWGDLRPFGSRFSLMPAPLRSDLVTVNATSMTFDATDGRARSRAEQIGHRQVWLALDILRRYVPGFADARLHSTVPAVSVRASRRIAGVYQLTREDVENERRFADAVARGAYPMSVQSTTSANVRRHLFVPNGGDYDVPLRCFVPEALDGVFVAGRSLSATREALGSARMGAQCMAYGQAVGVAAALSVRHGQKPREIRGEELHDVLKGQGAIV